MSETFFFDTYALIEVIRGNPKYVPYSKAQAITTIFNIAELNYILKKEHPKKVADDFTNKYKPCTIKFLWEDIINAMDLKTKHRNLSIPNAIGYIVAKRYNVKFLTGDEDFKALDNVEFIKR
jgi:predicted nucleic acid-binding protein